MHFWQNINEKFRHGLGIVGGIIREYAYQNLGLKLVALLIAVVLWGAVSKQEVAQTSLQSIRLQYVGLPEGLAISNDDYLESANVQLRGPKDVLNRLRADALSVKVDLSNFKPGERVVQLSRIDVLVPPNVEVVDIEPQRTHITIERIVSRQVKVVARFTENTPQDYEVVSYSLNPSMVTISGPESRVNAVPDAPTEPIRLAEHRGTFVERPNIDIKDLKVRIVDSPTIEIQVQIGQIRIERQITNVPLRMVPGMEKVNFSPATIAVGVEGMKSVIDNLKPTDISAQLDFENLPDTGAANVKVMLPPTMLNSVTVKSVDPPQVHIKRRH